MTTTLNFRASRAVVIGIDAYRSGIPSLRTAVADARSIAEILESDHDYMSPHLLTEDVSLARLRQLFAEKLPAEVGPDDRVLVYFAGHGIALDGDDGPAGYLVPQDARRDDRTSFLPMTELSACLERLPCRHLLLVLDCCFAGAFRWSSTRDLGSPPEVIYRERFDRFIQDPAWQVITSAAYDQKALDVLSGETIGVRGRDPGQSGHSPFAAAFLRALAGEADVVRGKQPVGDGVVTATELYMFLRDEVGVGAEGVNHHQTPGLWPLKKHDKGEYVHLVPGHELKLPPAPELTDAANPWRGLQSYDEEQAPLFFGRKKFVALLAERVKAQPLTVVLGASGTGKSSVAKAGLLCWFRSQEPDAWAILPPIRPGKSPLTSLAALALPGETSEPDAVANRISSAKADAEALVRRVSEWKARTSPGVSRLLLVVDQFEELITLCLDDADRDQALLLLDRALAAHPDRLRVVLTLRSDFEPQFAKSPLQEEWLVSRIVVPAWTLDEYREVIEGPASARVLYFQSDAGSQAFINRLIGDVANTPGALPLLSFTLSELYRRYLARGSTDRSLTEDDYDALGGVGGSLRNRADEIYDGLPDNPHRATLERVMLRMVSVEGGELARKRVLKEEIVYASEDENLRIAEVLQGMVEARLIVSGKDEDDRPIFEPAHDELIRGWSRLLEWTRESLGSLQLREVLSPAVRDWCRDPQPDSGKLWHANPRLGLLSSELGLPHQWHKYLGQRLRDWLRRSPTGAPLPRTWLNRDEERFVVQSLTKRHRTTSIVVVTTFATVAVLAGLTLFAFFERGVANEKSTLAERRARISDARRLATQSAAERAATPPYLQRSVLLAIEAVRATKDHGDEHVVPAAEQAMHDALGTIGGRPLSGHAGTISRVLVSPDGDRLFTASVDATVRAWDLRNPKLPPRVLRGHTQGVSHMTLTPDGQTLITGSLDSTVRVWDLTRPLDLPKVLEGHEGGITGVTVTTDGRTVITSGLDPTARAWDLHDLDAPPRFFRGHEKSIISTLAVPTTRRFVTLSNDTTGRVWDLDYPDAKPAVLNTFETRGATVSAVSPDGKWLVTGGPDSRLRAWDLSNLAAITPLMIGDSAPKTLAAVFSPESVQLATAGDDGVIRIWSVSEFDRYSGVQPLAPETLTGHTGWVTSLSFHPGGHYLASTGGDVTQRVRLVDGIAHQKIGTDPTVRVWHLNDRQSKSLVLRGHEGTVQVAAFTPDGNRLVSGGDDGIARIWDVKPEEPIVARTAFVSPFDVRLPVREGVSPVMIHAHRSGVQAIALTDDGRVLATFGFDMNIGVWRVRDAFSPPELIKSCEFREGDQIAFSAASEKLVVTSPFGFYDWSWKTDAKPKPLGRVRKEPKGSPVTVLSGDGGWLAVNGETEKTLNIYDLTHPDLAPVALPNRLDVYYPVLSNDGRHVVGVSDEIDQEKTEHSLVFWDRMNPTRPPRTLPWAEGVRPIAVSRDGRLVVRAEKDEPAALLDVSKADRVVELRSLDDHAGGVAAAAFRDDDRILATAGSEKDRTVRLWDLARLEEESIVLAQDYGEIRQVRFSRDARCLAVVYNKGMIGLWHTSLDDLLRLGHEVVGRDLSERELRRYLPSR